MPPHAARQSFPLRSVRFTGFGTTTRVDSVEFDTEVDGPTGHVPLLVTVYQNLWPGSRGCDRSWIPSLALEIS